MSRSNLNRETGVVYYRYERYAVTPERFVQARRPWTRKARIPQWGFKRYHNGPPVSLKAIWKRQARRKQAVEFRACPDDPTITPMKRLINLWNWY